jgi:hypothetical protein
MVVSLPTFAREYWMQRDRFGPSFRCLAALAAVAGVLGACTGTVGEPNSVEGAGGPGGGAPGGGGPGDPGLSPGGPPVNPGPGSQPAACGNAGPGASPLHARLLSPRQYDNTIQDLLGVAGNHAREFGGGADTQLDDLGAERRANAAAAIARQAAGQLAAWAPCTAATPACKQQIIDRVGMRAFRHPLSAAERQQLTALFDAGVAEKDFATGVEWFLTGLLQAPDFLYLLARPAAGERAGALRPIAGYEMASRLAYFVWDSMPDDQLFTAAGAAGGLADAAGVGRQIERMIADRPRFLRGIGSFYSHWLAIEGLGELARDDKAFTTELVVALGKSLLMSATQLYAGPAPRFTALLGGQTYYLDGTLRAFYGKGAGGAEFAATEMAGEQRHGLLTHPALMAQLARPQKTHPINRGLFVRGKLLCQELHPPQGDIPQLPEAPVTGVTTREEVAEHSSNPACSACHALLDPPGFALENFDHLGRRRDTENGRPVDSSGTMLNGGDLDGPFARGDELLSRFAGSQTVRGCFAQEYFQFAMTGDAVRPVADADRCSLDRVGARFAASGDLSELVASIAGSDAFRFRLSEGGTP